MAAPADPNKTQLKLGLAAAKNKDYGVAIAHLRQVKPGPAYEQAQQALVIALSKTGSVEDAIARCQPLLNSAKPETRQWAKTSLAKLQQHQPQPVSSPSPNKGSTDGEKPSQSPIAPTAKAPPRKPRRTSQPPPPKPTKKNLTLSLPNPIKPSQNSLPSPPSSKI